MKRIISLIFYLITFSTIVFGQDAWEVIGDMPNPVAEGELGVLSNIFILIRRIF